MTRADAEKYYNSLSLDERRDLHALIFGIECNLEPPETPPAKET